MFKVLTKEQEVAVDNYTTLMLKNGIKCGEKTDLEKARGSIDWLYKNYLDAEPPKNVMLKPSPEAAIKELGGKKELANEILFVSLWTWWVAYCHGGINILGETEGVEQELIDNINVYEKICREMYAILPCENTCFVIEYPKKVYLKDDDLEKFQFHREGGLAMEYNDGTGFAWLNGIEVPDWVACKPPSKLSVKKLLAEQNTDARREGFKRIGVAEVLKKLKAKVIDKRKATKDKPWDDYELLEANFGDKIRRFLKMKNPTSGDYVIEQVSVDCSTIDEANAMQCRETKYVEPETLT